MCIFSMNRAVNLCRTSGTFWSSEIEANKHPPLSKNERQVLDIFVFFSEWDDPKENGMLFDLYTLT